MSSFFSFRVSSASRKDFSFFCNVSKSRAGGRREYSGEVCLRNSEASSSRESSDCLFSHRPSFSFLSFSFPHTFSSSSLSFAPSSVSSPPYSNMLSSRFLNRCFFQRAITNDSSSFSSFLKSSSSLSFSSSSSSLPSPSVSSSPIVSTPSSSSSSFSGVHTPYPYLSPPRYSFFFSGYSTPQSPQKKARGISITFVAVVFLMPTICVYFGSSPSLLNWWMRSYRLVEYFPQADPRIIPAIFHGKTPPAKSEDSDIHTNR
ncbi:transmembrane protein [Cystoisospora suis]|uniref:Transmembrane protein n=1 Tax=Cystoisospora suis TaxID=483139 RepID=A0A2C6KES7_9APIC|nr:transmembrane protein [Cystoisospora suis]